MRLTQHTDYALRTLLFLALHPDEVVTIEAIARHHGVSRNHLMKVVQQLAHLGYVETTRGRGGGVRLAQPPAAISIGAVVRAVESDWAVVECMSPEDTCVITPACGLRTLLEDAREAFLAVLDARTLADALGSPNALVRLLRRHAARASA